MTEQTPPRLIDLLQPKQQSFVYEYLADKSLNAKRAAIKAGYSPATAESQASRLLRNVKVAAAIEQERSERAERLKMTADDVMLDLQMQARADRHELTQHRIGSCRYCWSIGHRYHWRTHREFADAMEVYMGKGELHHAIYAPPDDEGGYGYRKLRDPNPDCPECEGLGISFTTFADTSKLSPEARAIFGGVKETKDGISFILPDRAKALELIGKNLGMFVEKHEHGGKDGKPIKHEVTTRVVIVPAKEPAVIITRDSDPEDDEP